jgi:hypothetical protein
MPQIQLLTLVLLLWALLAPAGAAPAKTLAPAQVQTTNHLGWTNAWSLTGSAVRAVVIPQLGGRIVEYSLKGQNILYVPPGANAQAAEPVSAGYQCDLGPELRPIPPHPDLWTGPYVSSRIGAVGVRLRAESPALGVQLEKEILIEPESGDLGLAQRMRNISKKDVSFCLWDRTLCEGGGFAFFPIKKKKSRFPARWSIRRSAGEKFLYDGSKPSAPNVRIVKNVLIAKCQGAPTKVGADSDAGWIAYVRGRWLFVKYFPYNSKGQYTDGGNSVELYFDDNVAELEPLSPEIKLKPGETYEFPERWTLIELDATVSSFDEARALVDKVPPSPFD